MYAPGMLGFAQWLASDPQGSQIASAITPGLMARASALSPGAGPESLPTDASYSALLARQLRPALASAVANLPSAQQAPAAAAINSQLNRAAAGVPPIDQGMLYMGTSIIRLGNTCLTFGATELTGGTLLLVLALGALVVTLILFHRRAPSRAHKPRRHRS